MTLFRSGPAEAQKRAPPVGTAGPQSFPTSPTDRDATLQHPRASRVPGNINRRAGYLPTSEADLLGGNLPQGLAEADPFRHVFQRSRRRRPRLVLLLKLAKALKHAKALPPSLMGTPSEMISFDLMVIRMAESPR